MFRFNLEKSLQAIATLFRFQNSKEMSYLRLLKLLYIADRESIKETGMAITGDHVLAMKHGPVLSEIYNLIRGEHTGWQKWSRFFQKVHYRIEIIGDPGNGTLSKFEIAKLREITERYADKDDWEIVEITHTFEEWKKNDPGESCKGIPFDDILAAVGRIADKEAIIQEANDQAIFEKLFASVRK